MQRKYIQPTKIFFFSFLLDLIRGIFFACFVTNLVSRKIDHDTVILAYSVLQFSLSFFEPITGFLADIKGRKKCTLSGVILYILGLAVLAFELNSISIFASFILAGIGQNLFQGAKPAWLISVTEENIDINFSTKNMLFILDRLRRIGLVLGAFLAELTEKPEEVWILTGVLGCLCIAIGLSINSEKRIIKSENNLCNQFLDSIFPIHKNCFFWGIIVVSAIYAIETGNRDSVTQIYVKEFLSGNQFAMTRVQFFVATSGILGSFIYTRFLQKYSTFLLITVSLITVSIVQTLFAFWITNMSQFCVLISVQCLTLGWFYPLCDSILYNSINHKFSATALSLQNMVDSFFQGISCWAISKFALGKFPIETLWSIGSIATFICAIVLNGFLFYSRAMHSSSKKLEGI